MLAHQPIDERTVGTLNPFGPGVYAAKAGPALRCCTQSRATQSCNSRPKLNVPPEYPSRAQPLIYVMAEPSVSEQLPCRDVLRIRHRIPRNGGSMLGFGCRCLAR